MARPKATRKPIWAVTHHRDELISRLASTRAFWTSTATILRGLILPRVKKRTTGAFRKAGEEAEMGRRHDEERGERVDLPEHDELE